VSKYSQRFALASIAFAVSFAPIVGAQTLQEQVRTCSAETDAARRLSCYDRAAAALDKAAPAARIAASTATAGKAPPSTPASTPANSDAAEFGVSEGPLAAKKQATGTEGDHGSRHLSRIPATRRTHHDARQRPGLATKPSGRVLSRSRSEIR
jgi:hypothetical protein